jgi:adenylate cyclase
VYSQSGSVEKGSQISTYSPDQLFLKKVEKVILTNIQNEQFGVKELAEEMHYSRFQFYRKINTITGLSISQFIRRIRLIQAMELLKNNAGTASEIAYAVGFGSATYFSKCFHDQYNITPGEVRKRPEYEVKEIAVDEHLRNLNGYSGNIMQKVSPDSIAVLPFVNMSDDPEQEYFCDGISEEIINTIAQFPDLKVAGRTSSFSFKGQNIDIRQIGKTLGVSKVLEGSIRKSGDLIRISVQLLETSNGYHIWSKRYDRTLDDVFAVQDEIALEIASQLKMALSSTFSKPAARKHTQNIIAYQLYFKGRSFYYQRGNALFDAVKCFNQALEIDPHYALAFSGLADSYVMLMFHGFLSPADYWKHAVEALQKAIQYGPDLAETCSSIGIIALFYEWDWKKAEKYFQKAIAANPVFIQAYVWYGLFYFLYLNVNIKKGIELLRLATEVDPLSGYAHAAYSWGLSTIDRYEDAIREGKYSLKLAPDSAFGHLCLGSAYAWMGNLRASIQNFETVRDHSGDFWLHTLYALYHKMNEHTKAMKILDKLEDQFIKNGLNASSLAIAYAIQGRKQDAVQTLHKACYIKDPNVIAFAGLHKDAAILRSIPGYEEIYNRTGLKDLWNLKN